MTKRLAVIVVNYGSHELLADNVAELNLDSLDARCVIVDNFTTADELAAVRSLADGDGWEVVAGPANVGFGEGFNLGVARAKGLGRDS